MSKLFDTLKLLSEEEMTALSRFMHSPYFVRHSETISLFDYVAPFHPNFEGDIFEGFIASVSGRKITRARFHVLCTYVLKEVHRFLMVEQLEVRPVVKQGLLVDRLREKGRYREAQKQAEKMAEAVQRDLYMDSDNFFDQLRLKEVQLDLAFSAEMEKAPGLLREFLGDLDRHELLLNLKYLLPTWSFSRIFGFDFPQGRWNRIKAQVVEVGEDWPPLVMMYFHLLHLVKGEEEAEHLPKLQGLLERHAAQLSKTELRNIFANLQNYFTRHVHIGTAGALEQQFRNYQQMDAHNLIFHQGEMSARFLRNITMSGCRQGKQAWVAAFLAKHAGTITQTI
ncbi:MAG: hypothetical protein AAF570_28915, partial [Bacteroidota bacterium]